MKTALFLPIKTKESKSWLFKIDMSFCTMWLAPMQIPTATRIWATHRALILRRCRGTSPMWPPNGGSAIMWKPPMETVLVWASSSSRAPTSTGILHLPSVPPRWRSAPKPRKRFTRDGRKLVKCSTMCAPLAL